jgi:hypothetical protein
VNLPPVLVELVSELRVEALLDPKDLELPGEGFPESAQEGFEIRGLEE